jgi:aminoglycoside phosphotransferase (APT) family kinase protein
MELDIENFDALRGYLTQMKYAAWGETVSMKNLQGGVSNRTVKVSWADGRAWVLKQALPKLRVSVDWFSSPERIGVEAKALRWLNRLAPPGTTPDFIFEDMRNYLVGMEAIPDAHENWKSVLLSGQVVSTHFEQFGSLLGTIHRNSSGSVPEIRAAFADTTYFENLRLDPYYMYAAEKMASASEFLRTLAHETLTHKDSLVHGDFSPKNTLIYQGKLILLDYEVVHFGDPAFDVGFAMTHFLSKAHHLPRARADFVSVAELFWRVYRQEIAQLSWAGAAEPRVIRHTLACLLARVTGKSPLEYLTLAGQTRQRDVVLALIGEPPTSVPALIVDFVTRIETYA